MRYIGLLLLIPLLVTPLAFAETSWQHGYNDGVADGKKSARDSADSCINSFDNNECYQGYNLGFKQGCAGMMWYRDPYPEYMTCYDYFHQK